MTRSSPPSRSSRRRSRNSEGAFGMGGTTDAADTDTRRAQSDVGASASAASPTPPVSASSRLEQTAATSSKRSSQTGYHRSMSEPLSGRNNRQRSFSASAASPPSTPSGSALDRLLLSSTSPESSSSATTTTPHSSTRTSSTAMGDDLEFNFPAPVLPNLDVIGEGEELAADVGSDGRALRGSGGGGGGEQEPDLIGEALERALNDPMTRGGRAFRYHGGSDVSASPGEANIEADDDFHPLLSSYNLTLLQDMIRQMLTFLSSLIFDRKAARQRYSTRPTWNATLRSTAVLVIAATTILAAPTTVVVLFSVRTIMLTVAFLATLLVDYREVQTFAKNISPDWLVGIATAVTVIVTSLTMAIWNIIDGYVLLGREFAGRDGERPTSITDRSEGTQDHLHALSFCASMVSEAEIVRVEERCRRVEALRAKKEKKKKNRSPRKTTRKGGSSVGGSVSSNASSLGETSSRRQFRPRGRYIGRSRVATKLESNMPDGDELLNSLINEGDEEVYSDCLDSPLPRVFSNVSSPGRGGGVEESIEVIQSPSEGVDSSSYDFRSNAELERLLSTDDDESHRQWSSTGSSRTSGTTTDEYNLLSSSGVSVGSGSESSSTEGSYGSSSATSSVPSAVANYSPVRPSKKERELNWFDVGTKVGIRLLNSEKVQQLIKDPAEAEKFFGKSGTDLLNMTTSEVGNPSPDRNSITSASARIAADVKNQDGADSLISSKPSSAGDTLNLPRTPFSASAPARPMHALWTRPEAAAAMIREPSLNSISGAAGAEDDNSVGMTSIESRSMACLDTNFHDSLAVDDDDDEEKVLLSPQSSCLSHTDGALMNDIPQSRPSPTAPACAPVSELMALQKESQDSSAFACVNDKKVISTHGDNQSTDSVRPKRKLATPSKSSINQPAPCRRPALLPGVKIVLPMIPILPHGFGTGKQSKQHRHKAKLSGACHYQMATVISSERIYVRTSSDDDRLVRLTRSVDDELEIELEKEKVLDETNCLSITAILDKSYLRNGKFATMTVRVLDEWRGEQYMPRHSKYPIGSCVATLFGVGVLVGWRVEDDIHVVRSLWQKRGSGSAIAYLNRSALNGVVQGGIGFKVTTTRGKGEVVAYTNGGRDFLRGNFAVKIKPRDRHVAQVITLSPDDVLSCKAAKFMPVMELIKVAAQYQIQLEMYELAMRQRHLLENDIQLDDKEAFWCVFEDGIEMMMACFLKAIGEDQEFDEGMNEFLTSIIDFLEQLDFGAGKEGKQGSSQEGREIDLDDTSSAIFATSTEEASTAEQEVSIVVAEGASGDDKAASTFWDMFGEMFKKKSDDIALVRTPSAISSSSTAVQSEADAIEKRTSRAYRKIYAFLKTTMRSVAIARASVPDQPNLQLGLSIVYDFLLFIRTIIKVQQANLSPESVQAWKSTFKDFVSIFGPMKERMAQLGGKVAKRLERHGRKAKIRLLRFIDIILADEQFLQSLELLEWADCIYRIEYAVVKAKIVDAETCAQYHKASLFLYETLAPRPQSKGEAAQRNEEKLAHFAFLLKLMATPHRSVLKFLTRDDVLDLIERLLVRVFQKDSEAARMLSIHAFNAKSFRHFRMLKNMPISGKLWGPLLDAAVEEFTSVVDSLPDNGKVFIEPISKLFTLGVVNFHKIRAGDINALSAHWLDFLAKDDAVEIIQELDLKLRTSLDRFCKDVKEVLVVLPYYSSIDEDILQLIDEVSIRQFLKEAADALVDADRFPFFLKEKTTFAVSRFLDYLPKMSIPIERREIGEGWVVTCRGKNGEDLRLSDVQVKQENLTCEVLGGENILSPMFELKKQKSNAASQYSNSAVSAVASEDEDEDEVETISVLTDIADLLRNAQLHGAWESGRGGVKDSKKCIDPALKGLPVSEMLKCGIELWQNMEIDDDELMELAIRDVTYQIQLQNDIEEGKVRESRDESNLKSPSFIEECKSDVSSSFDHENAHSHSRWSAAGGTDESSALGKWRFNPRNDPTLLYLELLNMTFSLDEFLFRIEPAERSTIFDPVFEGYGSLMIKNVSIKLRLECRKERTHQLDTEVFVPILQVETLEVALEKVKFKFKSTGADWLLNGLVKGARDIISEVVESKVKEQIVEQIEEGLANVNSYLASNPDLLLNVLGISIDDLEEHVVYL